MVLAVWLAGQIVTLGAADHYAADRPAAAVLWRGDSPDALTSLAQRRLIARDPGHAALLARRALEEAPLQVAALSALGVALDEAGQADRAETVMTFAGSRGWRDALAQYWLFGHRLQERRYPEAFARADALLRRADQFRPQLLAVLTAVADTEPAALPALADRLKAAPDWRPAFLAFLCAEAHPQSEAAAYALLTALARGPTPPTDVEIGAFVQRLIRLHRYQDAASAWRTLSRSSAAAQLVVDGDFDHAAAPDPFGWSAPSGVGWTVSIDAAPGDGRGQALRIEYDGFASPQPMRQMLVLPAGGYRLSGRVYAETAAGADRFHWSLTCTDGGPLLARTTPAGIPQGRWTPFAADVSVPASGCPAQWLQLTADQGDHHTDIVVWFDDIAVARR